MNSPLQQKGSPGAGELEALLGLVNAGRLPQAEATARALLNRHPRWFVLHNVLGVCAERQGRLEDAAQAYRSAIALQPDVGEMHFNLGAVVNTLGRIDEALACYRRAVELKPTLAEAHYNLGIALQGSGNLAEAAACYRRACTVQPGFHEAHGNLGTVLQKQGLLEDAIVAYRKALAIQPDARGWFNLATALRDEGRLEDAGASYLEALRMNPRYADAHNNLGEVFRDQGRMTEGVNCYQTALAIEPGHPNANYNMGEFLCLAGKYDEARDYFERSTFADARERALECLYRTERYDEFRERLGELVRAGRRSTLLAALSTHHAINFGVEDPYDHCPDPMRFVRHTRIEELAEPGSALLQELLRDIAQTPVAQRRQGRLYYGMQSAGNLLKRPEPSFRKLAELIRQQIAAYQAHYAGEDCGLIRHFPRELEFSSSWFLRMSRGGHLTSHIHEEGWISGCVYLVLPREKARANDAGFEYGPDGDDLPRQHDRFESHIVLPEVGDIVLFPSSLYHRTLPFGADEERVCVAFDVKPAA